MVIGLGRFGTAVATKLVELGVEVLGLDNNQSLVDIWADRLTHVRVADATSTATLEQLGITEFDAAVVAIGSDIESSVLATSALVDLGVRNVWAKAITAQHGRILERVGAHHVVYPEREMGERVAHIVNGDVVDYFEFDEHFAMASVQAPVTLDEAVLGDSGLRDRFGVTVVYIKPLGGHFTHASADTVVHKGDLLIVAGQNEDLERFADFTSA
ncbi:MAG: TrkA family potassium uptake protein [Actinomycetia bacterium]|nr:TrkA family potassium uptake protein [Actinomycetes bacterium]MCP5028871.1 TrkA family potassium uptake protein [Actinomycetes bacterium]